MLPPGTAVSLVHLCSCFTIFLVILGPAYLRQWSEPSLGRIWQQAINRISYQGTVGTGTPWGGPSHCPREGAGQIGHLGQPQPQHPHSPGDRAWQKPWLGRAGLWELETIPAAASLGQGLAGLRGSNSVLGCRQGRGSPDRAGEATDAVQALTALCLVGLLALTELRMHLLQWR